MRPRTTLIMKRNKGYSSARRRAWINELLTGELSSRRIRQSAKGVRNEEILLHIHCARTSRVFNRKQERDRTKPGKVAGDKYSTLSLQPVPWLFLCIQPGYATGYRNPEQSSRVDGIPER